MDKFGKGPHGPVSDQFMRHYYGARKGAPMAVIAFKFPEAFKRGVNDCAAYYANGGEGSPYPPHPYAVDETSQREQEWHAYNAGWFSAIPDE